MKCCCSTKEVTVAEWIEYKNLDTVVLSSNPPNNGNSDTGVLWPWSYWIEKFWQTKNFLNFIGGCEYSRCSRFSLLRIVHHLVCNKFGERIERILHRVINKLKLCVYPMASSSGQSNVTNSFVFFATFMPGQTTEIRESKVASLNLCWPCLA